MYDPVLIDEALVTGAKPSESIGFVKGNVVFLFKIA
jgi:hypothetical protein